MSDATNDVSANLAQLRERIAQACETAGRNPDSIKLIAVSKKQSAEKVRHAIAAKQQDFGENYLQEALEKITALEGQSLTWHFIGPIQSNKTRDIAAHFDWVHSVDRYKIARRLSEQRPEALSEINICLQVNISDEDSKSGLAPADVADLAGEIAELPRLKLRGLMTIPAPADSFESQRKPFAALRELKQRLEADHPDLDTLSMGMTADLEAAIAEGATMLRVGTAIFGARD